MYTYTMHIITLFGHGGVMSYFLWFELSVSTSIRINKRYSNLKEHVGKDTTARDPSGAYMVVQ